MIKHSEDTPFSQRQLRVGELIKQSLGQIFLRGEAKVPTIETKNITVTEVRMSPDLKTAKVFVIPLGGTNTEVIIEKLKISSFIIRKVLSKKITMKFLPKILFAKDESFEYTSFCPLTTEFGVMHGVFYMIRDSGEEFKAIIKPFKLAVPFSIN